MKQNKLWLILIPLVLVAVILFGVAGYMLLGNNSSEQYTELLLSAEAHIENGDYDSAIDAYEKAIELDNEDVFAYRALMNLYVQLGQPEMALKVINDYTALTQDTTLQTQYAPEVENRIQQAQEQQAQAEQLTEVAEEKGPTEQVTLNQSLLTFISGATFDDYTATYGNATVELTGNGSVLTYQTAPLVCSYLPDDGNVLVDKAGNPFGSSRPTAVSLTDVSALLVGMTGSVSLDVIQADPALSGAKVVESGGSYVLEVTVKGCQIQIACDASGTIANVNAWNEIRVVQLPEETETEKCTLDGMIVNATSGKGVEAVTMNFREGFGNETGEILETVISDGDGAYEIDLESGDYTVEVIAEGFITEFFDITIHSWFSSDEISFTISPELKEGEIRIVLEWGVTPQDLDSYLFGVDSAGNRVRVCFTDMVMDGVAALDVDCMNGFGPETMTIYDIGGTYQFVVADYNVTGTLAQSGATVKIYMPGESQPTIVDVCSSAENDWLVCTISNGQLYVDNTPFNGSSTTTIK